MKLLPIDMIVQAELVAEPGESLPDAMTFQLVYQALNRCEWDQPEAHKLLRLGEANASALVNALSPPNHETLALSRQADAETLLRAAERWRQPGQSVEFSALSLLVEAALMRSGGYQDAAARLLGVSPRVMNYRVRKDGMGDALVRKKRTYNRRPKLVAVEGGIA